MDCYGQDWASYQSPAPDVTGLSFAFVKATEGLTYANPRWAQQVAYARLHKLTVGHYHYPHMGNSATAEADFFLRTAQPQPGDVVALDWEGYDVANRSVSFAAQVAYKKAFLAHVTAALPHNQVGTYCNTDYLDRDPAGAYGDFLWIATANKAAGQPGINRSWLFHQYSASSVDRDYCNLSADALRAWAHAKENDMTPEQEAKLDKVIALLEGPGNLTYRNTDADAASMKATGKHIPDVYGYLVDTNAKVSKLSTAAPTIDYAKLAAALLAQMPRA